MDAPFFEKLQRVKQVVKLFLQRAPNQLYAYAIENMGEDIGAEAFRNQTSGPLSLRNVPRNMTDKLNFRTNKLSRSLAPNEAGNITKIGVVNNRLQVEYGIDPKVVPYARIHEFGGTIKHPGGTHYRVVDGRAVFVNKAEGKADNLKTTKPHDIKIRARPYLRPAFIAFSKKQVPRLLQQIKKAIEED
jgi:hypothetical protein